MEEFKIDYKFSLEDFKDMEKIEYSYFKDDNISPAKECFEWYKKNDMTCVGIRNSGNKVIASVSVLPLKQEVYNDILNNNMNEADITHNQIEKYQDNCEYYIYLSSISIDYMYRNNYKLITTLMKGCVGLFDFLIKRREYIMPQNKMQRMIFALLTVLVTVHAYVFYSLYVVNGNTLMEVTGAKSVTEAINVQGGVYMFGHMVPIWEVVIIEFVCAFVLEMLVGSQFSFKFASKVFNPKETHPVLFETAIICATVGIMCPAMSFLAAIMYYPYYAGFNIFTLLANFLKLVCFNFPFAFFTQLFFIQPFIRTVFKMLFRKNNNVEQIKKAIA